MYRECLHKSFGSQRKFLYKPKTKPKQVFALIPEWATSQVTQQMEGWRILDIYTVTWSQNQVTSAVTTPAEGKIMGFAASGSWREFKMPEYQEL
jgi:hypothetical protein